MKTPESESSKTGGGRRRRLAYWTAPLVVPLCYTLVDMARGGPSPAEGEVALVLASLALATAIAYLTSLALIPLWEAATRGTWMDRPVGFALSGAAAGLGVIALLDLPHVSVVERPEPYVLALLCGSASGAVFRSVRGERS